MSEADILRRARLKAPSIAVILKAAHAPTSEDEGLRGLAALRRLAALSIVENAKQIQIKPIQMATAVRVKDEVDAIVLGNTLAMEGGLNVLKDSIYYEPIDQSTKMNVNILATAADRQNLT